MAQFYPEELIQEISNSNDIVDIISEYVNLKRSGKNLTALCPFHKEKTPSFSVSPDKQLFHCFGCGAGGNVINFVMKIEALDFIETVKLLAEKAGIDLPEADYTGIEGQRTQKKQLIKELNTQAAKFFYNTLMSKEGVVAREYLAGRKISERTIKQFGLGYAPNSKDLLLKHLNSQGFSSDDIVNAGLAILGDDGYYRDKFINRVMFPIFDIRGNAVAFGGRAIGNHSPKYLNSPETDVFYKSKIIYGMNFAKQSDAKELIIVEGYMDVISLHQHGINNAVATMGTALSEEHAKIISRYYKDVVIAFDSDEAGRKAVLRSMQILLNAGCRIKILNLDEEKDPDEYIKSKGVNNFKKAVSKAVGMIDYRIELLREKYNISNMEDKIDFVNEISETLASVKNVVELDAYIQKIASETGISPQAIYAQVKKNAGKFKNEKLPQKKENKSIKDKDNLILFNKTKTNLQNAEEMLLNLMVTDNAVFNRVKDFIKTYTFSCSINQQVSDIIFLLKEKKKSIIPAEILNHFTDKNDIEYVTSIFHKETGFDDNHKAADQLINTIKKGIMLNLIKDNINEGNVEKLKTLLQYKYKQS